MAPEGSLSCSWSAPLFSNRPLEPRAERCGIERGVLIELSGNRLEVRLQLIPFDEPALQQLADIFRILRVRALDFRQRLCIQVEMVI